MTCVTMKVTRMSPGQYRQHPWWQTVPDSKVHGANMGPIWGRQDPGGPHVGPINFVIWGGETAPLIEWRLNILRFESMENHFTFH